MNCPNCQREIPDDAVLCPYCGKATRPAASFPAWPLWLIAGFGFVLLTAGLVFLAVRLLSGAVGASGGSGFVAATMVVQPTITRAACAVPQEPGVNGAPPAAVTNPAPDLPESPIDTPLAPTDTPLAEEATSPPPAAPPTDLPGSPSATPESASPAPTSTPQVTESATPTPTSTIEVPESAGPTPTWPPLSSPIVLRGSGEALEDIDLDGSPGIVHIVGNAAGEWFTVAVYDAEGYEINTLVDTEEPYDGYVPLDWFEDEETVQFEIIATGEWTIEIQPVSMPPRVPRHVLTVPGTFSGNGDDVVILTGARPRTITIEGNAAGYSFVIVTWDGTFTETNLLLDTEEPYNGALPLDGNTAALEIRATGPWTIRVEGE